MLNKFKSELSFLVELCKLNVSAAMEFRFSFITQIVWTFINNAIYFIFWLIFFERFPEVGGYSLENTILLFAVVTTGFGIAFFFFGQCSQLANVITEGRLDYYLSYPKNLILHIIASRSSISAFGDILFGIMAFIFVGHISITSILLWIIVCLLVSLIFVGFYILVGSLSFWLGNSQPLTDVAGSSLLTFALYPNGIFKFYTKLILLTIIPSIFVGYVPVEIIKQFDAKLLGYLGGFSLFIIFISIKVFYFGLKKYESSNTIKLNN